MSEAHSTILSMSDEAFGWYLSGLVDGEGYFGFTHHRKEQEDGKGSGWHISFGIAMRADEAPGLKAIAERVGVGAMTVKTVRNRGRANEAPEVRWSTCRLRDLAETIVPRFEKFSLKLKKARDFEIWRQAVSVLHAANCRPRRRYWHGDRLLTVPEKSLLLELLKNLRDVRKFNSGLTLTGIRLSRPKLEPGPFPLFPE